MKRNTTLKGLVATLVIGAAMALPSLASAQSHGQNHGSRGGITIQFGSRSNNHGYSNNGYNSHRAQESHAFNDHRAAEQHAYRDHAEQDWYYGASRQHMAQEQHAYRDHRAAESHAYRDHRGGGH